MLTLAEDMEQGDQRFPLRFFAMGNNFMLFDVIPVLKRMWFLSLLFFGGSFFFCMYDYVHGKKIKSLMIEDFPFIILSLSLLILCPILMKIIKRRREL